MNEQQRQDANQETLDRLNKADPILIDVCPAGEVIPNMTPSTVLTSGAPLEWSEYRGGQRNSLIYGAVYEGLASDEDDAIAKYASGEIKIGACHHHGCVGSVAGIYTAVNAGFCGREPRLW